jgi:hypothetical protein
MITFLNIQDKLTKSILYCDTPVYSRKGKYRKLCTEVTFLLGNTQFITIKPGFTWDENSIPWILQPHERKWVEEEFRRWMTATGVNKRQIFFRYWAVKIFGWRWWNRNKKRPSDRCIHNRKLITLH